MVALGLVMTGILTRRLGTIGYGGYTLITASFVFLDSLADFGTKIIGVREVSKDENQEEQEKTLAQMAWLRGIMVVIAMVVGLAAVWLWGGFEAVRIPATVALGMLLLTSVGGLWEIIFQSKMRMDLKVIMDISFPLFLALALWFFQDKINLVMVFGWSLLARIISLIVGGIMANRLIKISFNFPSKKELMLALQKNWKISWPMGIYLMIFASYDRMVDSLMIQRFLGMKELAWYGLAYKMYLTLIQPAYFFVVSTFPLMSAKSVEKRKLFKSSFYLLMAGVVILIAGTQIMAPIAVKMLAGEGFEPAVRVLRWLIWASLFSYAGHLLGFTLIARGGQKEMLKIGVVGLIFNLLANWVFIPRYGILGAAGVTVITEAIGCGLMGWYLRKMTNV